MVPDAAVSFLETRTGSQCRRAAAAARSWSACTPRGRCPVSIQFPPGHGRRDGQKHLPNEYTDDDLGPTRRETPINHAEEAVMRDLNYQLKQLGARNRDGSYATRNDRARMLSLVANQLHELGYRHLRADSLKPKHVEALLGRWKSEDALRGHDEEPACDLALVGREDRQGERGRPGRFAASAESIAHPTFKKAFVRASARDAVASVQLDPRLPVIPVRALKNAGTEAFTAKQREVADRSIAARSISPPASSQIEHYWAGALRRAVIDGDVENGSLMAGQSVGMVTAEQPVAEIIAELVAEAETALAGRPPPAFESAA